MPRYFIHMAYDGSRYNGWQAQPRGNTVQQAVQHALATLLKQDVEVTGAGRTDAGVHASFFIAHFETLQAIDKEIDRLIFKLNRFLADDVVIYRIEQVPDEMHARFSAAYRTYHYHISTIKPLFTRNYSHYVYGPLDSEEISACCAILLETKDFTSFSKLHSDVKNNICSVMRCTWNEVENGYLFEIRADRFLRNMVRSIVGTLLDVGKGKLEREGFRAIIDARDRGRAGQSAPAKGLFLVEIGYEGAI